MYLSPVFLLTGLCLIFKRPKPKVATLLLFTGVISLFMNSAWTYRNRVTLGENAATSRFSIALAGKVARIDQMKFPEELPVALAASMGSNFCDEHFGPPSCERFDYRGCDKVGIRVLGEYSDQFGSKVLVENNIVRDMRRLFFRRPGIQLLGSFLEILRMGFFEAVLDKGTLPALMVPWARAWHAIGSALIWFLILLGLKELYFKYSSVDTSHRGLFWLFGGVIVYHFSTMSQVTNVVRYIFPVIPFLYLFASVGLASGIERVKVWRS
jgi:hypothetical protein